MLKALIESCNAKSRSNVVSLLHSTNRNTLTKGGPAQSTESISYLIYNNGMSGGQFGFQSANAVIFFIVIVVISVAQMKFTGSKEEQL